MPSHTFKRSAPPLHIVVAADNIPGLGGGLGYFLDSAIDALASAKPTWRFTIVACSSFRELSAKSLPNVRTQYWDDSGLQRLSRRLLGKTLAANEIQPALYRSSQLMPTDFLKAQLGNLKSYYRGLQSADVIWVPHCGIGDERSSLNRNLPADGPKILLTIHDIHPVFFPEDWPGEQMNRFRSDFIPLARRANRIITHTRFQKQAIATHLNVDQDNILVTPIPPSLAFADTQTGNGSNQDSSFNTADVHYNKPFVLYPGSTGHTHKNHTRLILAWADLRDRLGDACPRLICTAKGHLWPSLHALIAALSLKDKVVFLDTVSTDSLRWLFSHCLFVIVPTLYEGGGSGPVADGILAGKTVLCSDISVIREQMEAYGITDDGPVFFCPESIGAISAAAESALQSGSQLEAAARTNQAKLRSRMHSLWEEWAHFYCAAIEGVL